MTTLRAIEMIACMVIASGAGLYVFTYHCQTTRNAVMRINLAVMSLSAALVGIDIAMSYSELAHMHRMTRDVAKVAMLVTIAVQVSVLVLHAWRLHALMRRQKADKLAQPFRLPQFALHQESRK